MLLVAMWQGGDLSWIWLAVISRYAENWEAIVSEQPGICLLVDPELGGSSLFFSPSSCIYCMFSLMGSCCVSLQGVSSVVSLLSSSQELWAGGGKARPGGDVVPQPERSI